MLEVAKEKGLIKGIRIGEGAKELSHLQFADDTIIFLEQYVESVRNCKRILQCFQLTSGLRINFKKSQLYARGVDQNEIRSWADI